MSEDKFYKTTGLLGSIVTIVLAIPALYELSLVATIAYLSLILVIYLFIFNLFDFIKRFFFFINDFIKYRIIFTTKKTVKPYIIKNKDIYYALSDTTRVSVQCKLDIELFHPIAEYLIEYRTFDELFNFSVNVNNVEIQDYKIEMHEGTTSKYIRVRFSKSIPKGTLEISYKFKSAISVNYISTALTENIMNLGFHLVTLKSEFTYCFLKQYMNVSDDQPFKISEFNNISNIDFRINYPKQSQKFELSWFFDQKAEDNEELSYSFK